MGIPALKTYYEETGLYPTSQDLEVDSNSIWHAYNDLRQEHTEINTLRKKISYLEQSKTWLSFFACLLLRKEGILGRIDEFLCKCFVFYREVRADRICREAAISTDSQALIVRESNYKQEYQAFKKSVLLQKNTN